MHKKLRKTISMLFAFFVAFFMMLCVLLSIAKFTILSPTHFMKTMDAVAYYEGTAIQINQTLRQNAGGAGLPSELFDQYVKKEDIQQEMMNYQEAILKKETATIDTTFLRQRLHEDIMQYATEKKRMMNANTQKSMETFVNTMMEKVQYLMQFPFFDVYASLSTIYGKGYIIVMPILLVSMALLLLCIHKMYTSFKRRKRYYAYTCIGSGFLCMALPLYLYMQRFFEKINVTPAYMYNFMIRMMKDFLMTAIVCGGCLIVIGIIIAYVKYKPIKQNKRTYRMDQRILEGIEKV